jgi:glycosyltransferase involved in cell wall biosynthesis
MDAGRASSRRGLVQTGESVRIRFLLHKVHGQAGGVVTVTFDLAAELAKRHDVELVSVFGGDGDPVHTFPDGVAISSLIPATARSGTDTAPRREGDDDPSELVPKADRRYHHYNRHSDVVLADYLRSLEDGVLVTMQPALNIPAARVHSSRCVKVAQDHRPYRGRPRALLAAYQRHAAGLDMLLTLTDADAVMFRELLGDSVPVRALGNGTPEYSGALSDCTAKTVLAAGRLAPSKGFDVLVDAWALVAAQHPDWQLNIWGEGSHRASLATQISHLELEGQVHLQGFTRQLQEEMSRSSIFVLSSRAEGYPRVIVEAMACGVPVVSTDCPSGPREMIESGVDGLLVPSANPKALAAGIMDMIERGPEGRLQLGRAGLVRARARSQSVVAGEWESLLEDLVRQRSSRPPTQP